LVAPEDGQLVAEHEDLELLGSVAAANEHDQLEQPADNGVEGWHKQRRPPNRPGTPTLPPRRQRSCLIRSGFCTPRLPPRIEDPKMIREVLRLFGLIDAECNPVEKVE
jgi:hypothetical protein